MKLFCRARANRPAREKSGQYMLALSHFHRLLDFDPQGCRAVVAYEHQSGDKLFGARLGTPRFGKMSNLTTSLCSYYRAGCERPVSYSVVRTHTIVAAVLSAVTLYGALVRLFITGVAQHFKGMVIAEDTIRGGPCRLCFQDHRPCQPRCPPFGGG